METNNTNTKTNNTTSNTKQSQDLYKQVPLTSIKITRHAEQRIKERVNIKFNNPKDKLRFVYKARYMGISLAHASLQDLNLNKKLYDYLNKYYKGHKGTETIRLYQNWVFVFVGDKGRTLKTVIGIDQKFQSPN